MTPPPPLLILHHQSCIQLPPSSVSPFWPPSIAIVTASIFSFRRFCLSLVALQIPSSASANFAVFHFRRWCSHSLLSKLSFSSPSELGSFASVTNTLTVFRRCYRNLHPSHLLLHVSVTNTIFSSFTAAIVFPCHCGLYSLRMLPVSSQYGIFNSIS